MDTAELTRALVGLPVAAVVPPFVPGLRGRLARSLAACLLAIWAVGPALDEWTGWLLAPLAVLGSLAVGPTDGKEGDSLPRAAITAVVLTVVAAILLESEMSVDGLDAALSDSAPVVVTAGGLASVFLGGAGIALLLAPFADRARPTGTEELARAGLLIGWLERALLYGFVVAGASTGVAVVVAAKSLARLPSLNEEDRFAEYFLIGTLASVIVAVGIGVAVRAILGLSPLLT
jgi:hypothetical protein